ncbi:MAG: nitric oxide reductase activation protein NorD [Thermodesulfobacteriota bacterium]
MEYLIGKGIDRALRLRHKRKLGRWRDQKVSLSVKDRARRFSLFASMLTGKSMNVTGIHGDPQPRPYAPLLYKMAHPAQLGEHAFGWSDGETIFLPITSIHLRDLMREEELLKLSIFFLSFQIMRGTLRTAYNKRHILLADEELLDLYMILENKRLAGLIEREYPGAFKSYQVIVKELFESRPSRGLLTPREARAEAFLKDSVYDKKIFIASSSAGQSLALALETKKNWQTEQPLPGRYRAIMPFIPYGRILPGRIKDEFIESGGRPGSGVDKGGDEVNESRGSGEDKKRFTQKREEVDEEAMGEGLTLNIYDKFITWAEFVNVTRPFDDEPEDDMNKKAESMDEITTATIARSTNAFFDAELEKAALYDDDTDKKPGHDAEVFHYNEWDYRKKSYRENYATLTESTAEDSDRGFSDKVLKERSGLIKQLRRQFEILNPELRPLKRQIDGNDVDIDAVVASMCERAAGSALEDRLYIRDEHAERDMSALFLVDLSMSTETWVGDKRVIDHEKEALLLLAESMKGLRDRYAVYGFSGRNRAGCRSYHVKGFDEPYAGKVRDRIGALLPMGYTRMGPAIRHAANLLAREKSRIKLLFIVSDGKPNDMDVYEGRYGLEDTAMAIRETKKDGITPFCLTVDNRAGEYLPKLFGRGHYVVLSDAGKLVKTLPNLFARVVKGL